eukprot:GEMP01006152.1.p1 GENE.GEMP01006152.1~~GEMP01006152.1.p1  ORF type:complete len:882 (+),score=156.22 GEMP01006152.1:358-3003(+)
MLCTDPGSSVVGNLVRGAQIRSGAGCSTCYPDFQKYNELATMRYPFRNHPSPGSFCCCSASECACQGCQARQCSCPPPLIVPSGRAIYPCSYFAGPSTSSSETDVCARWRPHRDSFVVGHARFPERVATTTASIRSAYGDTTVVLASRVLELSDCSRASPRPVTSREYHSPPRVPPSSPIDGARAPLLAGSRTQSPYSSPVRARGLNSSDSAMQSKCDDTSAVHRESPRLGFRQEGSVLGNKHNSATRVYSPFSVFQSRSGSASPVDHSPKFDCGPLGSLSGARILERGHGSQTYTTGDSLTDKYKTVGDEHDEGSLDRATMDSPTAPSLLDNVYDAPLHSMQRDTPRLGTLLESPTSHSELGESHLNTLHLVTQLESSTARIALRGQQDDLNDSSLFGRVEPFNLAERTALLDKQGDFRAVERGSPPGRAAEKSATHGSSISDKPSVGMMRVNALQESQSASSSSYHGPDGRTYADGSSSRTFQEHQESILASSLLRSSQRPQTETRSNTHVNGGGSRGGATASAATDHSSVNTTTLYDLPLQVAAQHAESARQEASHRAESERLAHSTRIFDRALSASTAENASTPTGGSYQSETATATSMQGTASLYGSAMTDAQQRSNRRGPTMTASREESIHRSVATETREKKPPPPRMSHKLGVSHRLDGRFDSGHVLSDDDHLIWSDAGGSAVSKQVQRVSWQRGSDSRADNAASAGSAVPIRDGPRSILVPGASSSQRPNHDSNTRRVGSGEDISLGGTIRTNLSHEGRSQTGRPRRSQPESGTIGSLLPSARSQDIQKNEDISRREHSSEGTSRSPLSGISTSTNAGANRLPPSHKSEVASGSEHAVTNQVQSRLSGSRAHSLPNGKEEDYSRSSSSSHYTK